MTIKANVFDFETTGIPAWKDQSDAEHQPHIVEVAALLYDSTGNVIDRYQAIVRPDGWIIPEESIKQHGITMEQAMDEGIPEAEALDGFLAIHARAGIRVAHNATFDDRIARIAISRYHSKELADSFKESTEKYCTCQKSREPVGLKKLPTLAEAYKHFTGEDLVEAHRAMPDALACARVYFALQGVAMPAVA